MSDFEFLVGQEITFRARFRPATGYASPLTVLCRVQQPDGSLVQLTPTSDGQPGWFKAVFTPTQALLHVARWDGIGGVNGFGELPFMVSPPRVPAP